MADGQSGPVICRKRGYALETEMVGRLIQYQQPGRRSEHKHTGEARHRIKLFDAARHQTSAPPPKLRKTELAAKVMDKPNTI